MENNRTRSDKTDDSYAEFARKMALVEDGPTTTNFEQLVANGLELVPPESLADSALRTKLWEVIHGLSELRVYLGQTDHLSERQLYSELWHNVLREEVPAIDEIGFDHHVGLCQNGGEAEPISYLRYYADARSREGWLEQFPDAVLPAHEDLPFDRDRLFPQPSFVPGPEALAWLRANHNPHALASNRFPETSDAIVFVEQLYRAGAIEVSIDNITLLPTDQWAPYADTLMVDLPSDGTLRRELFELIEHVGRPDEADEPVIDCGQNRVRLWWH